MAAAASPCAGLHSLAGCPFHLSASKPSGKAFGSQAHLQVLRFSGVAIASSIRIVKRASPASFVTGMPYFDVQEATHRRPVDISRCDFGILDSHRRCPWLSLLDGQMPARPTQGSSKSYTNRHPHPFPPNIQPYVSPTALSRVL